VKRVLFLYSGEGTSDPGSQFTLLKFSQRWQQIQAIVESRFELDLESLWQREIGRHRCPHSPLLTLTAQVCLADLWSQWGYAPDVVLGHSIGELAAAYQAGRYDLEEIIALAHGIGQITAQLEGAMAHGPWPAAQPAPSPVHLSSVNFVEGDQRHVTVSGRAEAMAAFLRAHPDFVKMRLPHPWHHPDYARLAETLRVAPSRPAGPVAFVSGVTRQVEPHLTEAYWRRWLTQTVDFVGAMQAVQAHLKDVDAIQVIEIGFHPVLERACRILPQHRYASSMFRGEDAIRWIVHQRQRLEATLFTEALRQRVAAFRPALDFRTALAYQGFTSITFMEFAEHLQGFFPSLTPQDFYRFKSIDQLVQGFGAHGPESHASAPEARKQAVAIAGMSCRFPSAVETLPQFWHMLQSRQDQVRPQPDRADFEAGFLDDRVSRFDHTYFGIAEAEAQSMDPQQILALELAEMLWQDAGIDPKRLDRRRVGVYIGAWNQEYEGQRHSVYWPTGTNPSIIAARISYHYDLRGPSWVSNTACSSSLVAVHYAAKDIEAGRVDVAIAGGVNMILGRRFTASMRRSGFLSKADRCKTFDDTADGYARAEGGGLVLLARKELAPRYYALLAGSALNQNGGRAQQMTAPHPEAQEEVIREACREAGIAPQQIAFVECHGTGTKIGDPIEVSAIQNTVARDRDGICLLGSVKSNLGHLESAAGMAGLIKAVLSLNFGAIPPNLHFTRPNSFIDFAGHRLQVVSETTPIAHQAYVGVSSFGFGGANAHLVIQGADDGARKAVAPLEIPFDRARALPLKYFLPAETPAVQDNAAERLPLAQPAGGALDIRALVTALFFKLTGIESIDPELALIEQGLDSMSATELVALLEEKLTIELDPDLFFDFPLIDQLVAALEAKVPAN
jgi:acyl transferase domain-containing protein/acyl carrier protein